MQKVMQVNVEIARKQVPVSENVERKKYGYNIKYPCLQTGYTSNKDFIQEMIVTHVESCAACKVIMGKSEAIIMNQDQVAACFASGIDGKHSSKDNLRADGGILMHYGTIEAIRTHDNIVINNTQCWSLGHALCPRVPNVTCELPLSTLASIYRTDKLRQIKIIDKNDGNVLFTVPDVSYDKIWNETTSEYEDKEITTFHYMLFGHDEYEPFLTRLKVETGKEPRTVKEAYDSMVPYTIKGAMRMKAKVKRQGDLYFVPLPKKPISIEGCNTDAWRKENGNTFYYRFLSHARISNEEKQRYIHEHKISGGYGNNEMEIVKERKLYRPVIAIWNKENKLEDTNHVAEEKAEIIMKNGDHNITVVRGTVRHLNRQHAAIDLGRTWHAVVQNITEQTWNVPRRGGAVGGD